MLSRASRLKSLRGQQYSSISCRYLKTIVFDVRKRYTVSINVIGQKELLSECHPEVEGDKLVIG